MRPRAFAMLVLLTMIAPTLVGCFGKDEPSVVKEPSVFDFDQPIANNTFYHFSNWTNALDMSNDELNLSGNMTPIWALGTYYGTGYDTFEPTIGVTSSGTLVFTNHNGLGMGTHIIRSQDQGQNWDDVGPFLSGATGQIANSNDPYVYVDPWTDRIMKFDMHALAVMFVEWSDDEGESWSLPFPASGVYTPQDHQSIASVPPGPDFSGPLLHETVYVFCINTGAQGPIGAFCDTSLDGGMTWEGQVAGWPNGITQCAGLHGHLIGANDGAIYRGNPSCDGPAAYRSTDGGRTWSEHTIDTQHQSRGHEVAIGTDEASNVHALWVATDNLPYYSFSSNQGDTWSTPLMVAPPGVNYTGFPTIAGGADGRVVFGYIGESNHSEWSGYMGIITDAYAENPLITTVAVNVKSDYLDETEDCGSVRCGGFGDFIDVVIDVEGRPWIALSHNIYNTEAIIGTLTAGPALRGPLQPLTELPLGGPETLKM